MLNQKTFYDRLLLLPLFQGIARSDFYEIAERIPFGFENPKGGECFVQQGDVCSRLYFILTGEVQITRESDDGIYRITEWMSRPMAVQPHHLFGLNTRFTRSFTAASEVQAISVDKSLVRDVLMNYPTFRINFVNFLARIAEQTSHAVWRKTGESLSERFLSFLLHRCVRPVGQKELRMKMVDLADHLLATRLSVSQMLRNFEDKGVVTVSRGRISIPALEKLSSL